MSEREPFRQHAWTDAVAALKPAPSVMCVAFYLAQRADHKSGECPEWVNAARVMEGTGMSRAGAYRAAAWLKENGFIVATKPYILKSHQREKVSLVRKSLMRKSLTSETKKSHQRDAYSLLTPSSPTTGGGSDSPSKPDTDDSGRPFDVAPPEYPKVAIPRRAITNRDGAALRVYDEYVRLREMVAPGSGAAGATKTDACDLVHWVHGNLRGDIPQYPITASWRGTGVLCAGVVTFAAHSWRADNGSIRPLFKFIGAGPEKDYRTFRKFFAQWVEGGMRLSAEIITEANWGFKGVCA